MTLLVELYLDEVWTDITSYVRVDPGVTIDFGIRGEAGTADPAEITLTVNNKDGRFTPKNPEGAWYGSIKRGIPLRVSVDTVVRGIGEVSEFPARWEPTGTDVWVPLTASGPLRRLVRANALSSTLRTFLSRLGPDDGGTATAYWPMEDGAGSTSFGSGFAGGAPMTFIGTPGFAEVDGGAGSDPIASMDLVQSAGPAAVTPGSIEFTLGFLLVMPDTGTANGARIAQLHTSGTAAMWVLTYETGGLMRLRVYNGDGVEVENNLVNLALDGATRYIKLEVEYAGLAVNYALSATGVGTATDTILSATVTSPTGVYFGSSQSITGDVGIGHVILTSDHQTLFSHDFDAALRAYAGESVEDRLTRMGPLAGVAVDIVTVGTDTTLLGVQPDGDPLSIMRDAEAADAGGILRDSLNVLNSVTFLSRTARYNNSPVLELDYAANHLSPPLEPIDDDQLLANDVTVTRTNGSSARAVDVTGPLNSLPWPDGIGVYEKSVTLNVDTDEQLPDLAAWLLTLGTIDETRFPTLTVDLTKNPSLVTAADAVRPGYHITVTGLPDWAGAETVDLHVLGWTEHIGSHRRLITFNCTPGSPWNVIRLDDATFGRLDSDNTTTSEALDATETGVDYVSTDTWITTATHPAEFPFDIVIGGEVMTVTAATSSTFTVTRSVNGVVKTHLSGAEIRLANPYRLAL